MIELVFNSPDMATLQADAERLGFVDADGNIQKNGSTTDGGGWFLNIVDPIFDDPTPLSGVWGRLRVNGGPENLPAFSAAITIYRFDAQLNGWTVDGPTLAPDYVGNIGVIA